MVTQAEMELVNRIEKSKIQYFDRLACSLKKSDNIGIDLIKCGYQGYCSYSINSALRNPRQAHNETNELLIDISIKINNTLENHFKRMNSVIVWKRDWPTTSTYHEDLKILRWFEENIGKVLLFPSFLSCFSEKKRLPIKKQYFEITTLSKESNAFDISNLIPNHPEVEIIFKTNTKLKIMNMDKYNLKVNLMESEEQEDFIVTQHSAFHSTSILR